jgi:hypothetical protein
MDLEQRSRAPPRGHPLQHHHVQVKGGHRAGIYLPPPPSTDACSCTAGHWLCIFLPSHRVAICNEEPTIIPVVCQCTLCIHNTSRYAHVVSGTGAYWGV